MTFDEILDQAIDILQRRGRVTYRALKRRFSLDDEAVEDLKFELVEGQQLATDENDTVLVWIGDTGVTSPPLTPTGSTPASSRLPTAYAPALLLLSAVDETYRYARQGIIECQQYRCSTA